MSIFDKDTTDAFFLSDEEMIIRADSVYYLLNNDFSLSVLGEHKRQVPEEFPAATLSTINNNEPEPN